MELGKHIYVGGVEMVNVEVEGKKMVKRKDLG